MRALLGLLYIQVCKWFNLVVFTASVQEYADPVIDWLESERKFFAARYYRQHCTFRHGAFIKDLSSVEPDLSKVMILDNSPLSYMFHQGTMIGFFLLSFFFSFPLPVSTSHVPVNCPSSPFAFFPLSSLSTTTLSSS